MTVSLKSNQGMGLIFLVMLIGIGSILIASSARVFETAARQTQLRIDQAKAHYLAQAGVVKSVWDWYESNTATELSRRWSPVDYSGTPVVGNMFFKTGMDSAGARLHSNFAYFTSTSAPSIQFVQEVGTGLDFALPNAAQVVTTLAGGISVAQDNYLVIAVAQDGNSTANWACNDSQGTNYPLRANVVGPPLGTGTTATVRTLIFGGPVTTALSGAAGDTITVTWTTAILSMAMSVSEFSGVDAFDVATATGTNNSNAPNSGNATPNYVNELLFGAIGVEYTSATNFTPTVVSPVWVRNPPTRVVTAHGTALSNVQINPIYRIVSPIAAYPASGSLSATRDWSAAIATFKEHDRWFTDGGGNRRLRRWQIYNINNGNNIMLDQIKVSWTGGGGADLNDFVLNGVSYWPGGTAASGDTVDIDDATLANGGNWSGKDTYLQWDASPADPVTVTCQFIFSGDTATSDAKSHEVVLWDGDQDNDGGLQQERTFVVTSTGQVNQTLGGNFKVLKTVKAVISSRPGTGAFEVMDWDEGIKNIP